MPLCSRLLAFLALVGWFCSASGVLPTLAVFLGQLDRDHQVLVTLGDGALQVRFHHHAEHAEEQGAVIQAAANESHDDHVLQFVSAEDSVAQVSQTRVAGHLMISLTPIAAEQWLPVARHETVMSHARPPPGEATFSRCLHSVVLLV